MNAHVTDCEECGDRFACKCGYPEDSSHYCPQCLMIIRGMEGDYDLSEMYSLDDYSETYA